MVKINNNITQPPQLVTDPAPIQKERGNMNPLGDSLSASKQEGWLSWIGRLCTSFYIKVKNFFYKIFYFCKKKGPSLAKIQEAIKNVHAALPNEVKYKKAFFSLPEELQKGILFTTMQMITNGKILREGATPPQIKTQEELQQIAKEVLENPNHPLFDVKKVFEDYIQKLT